MRLLGRRVCRKLKGKRRSDENSLVAMKYKQWDEWLAEMRKGVWCGWIRYLFVYIELRIYDVEIPNFMRLSPF
jgi:hypothetical protein